MTVSLSKGQTVSLTKTDGGTLTHVRMGLGWDAMKKKGLFGGLKSQSIDLDASAGRWLRTGVALPDEQLDVCRAADAVYLGAVGLPEARFPDGREVNGEVILGLRTGLDLYAGIRPARRFDGVPRVLTTDAEIDYVVVRENVEGMFASRTGGAHVGDEVATDTLVITRAGTERVVRRAFELARDRAGRRPGRKPRVMDGGKSNPRGMTPTTVWGTWSTSTVFPRTAGSPPNRACQKE